MCIKGYWQSRGSQGTRHLEIGKRSTEIDISRASRNEPGLIVLYKGGHNSIKAECQNFGKDFKVLIN